jgi:hypothetical protein
VEDKPLRIAGVKHCANDKQHGYKVSYKESHVGNNQTQKEMKQSFDDQVLWDKPVTEF